MNNTEHEAIDGDLRRYGFDRYSLRGLELGRIWREAEIIHNRGWQEYIFFLAEFIKRLNASGACFTLSKSAMDSYLLGKMVDPTLWNPHKADNESNLDVLRNDALRLEVVSDVPSCDYLKTLLKINEALEAALAVVPLKYRQALLPDADIHPAQFFVLSVDEIPQDDMETIRNEQRESTDEEAAVLRKYLIMTIRVERKI